MKYLVLSKEEHGNYPICFLVPSIQRDEIIRLYIKPYGIDPEEVLLLDLPQEQSETKLSMKDKREYLQEEVMPILEEAGCQHLLVCDATYFKAITKEESADRNLGYIKNCLWGTQRVLYVPNYRTVFYNPELINGKIAQSMEALRRDREESYVPPGDQIIHFAEYPKTVSEIAKVLEDLLDRDWPLAIDIETFSLKHPTAGIGTITFCWNENEGVAFPVDYWGDEDPGTKPEEIRALLRSFFRRFKNKTLYHRITFDVYILIYQLFMKDLLDTEGLLEGMEIMLKNWDCTQLITYLATNSCAENKLSLKDQAQAFAGNYGLGGEIKDITKIPLDRLLQYNLVDGLSTWYVYNKHWPTVIADDQEEVYNTIFRPAVCDIIQMQLTGMPVNMERIKAVKAELLHESEEALKKFQNSQIIHSFEQILNQDFVDKKNAEYKKKRITLADADIRFNPNSSGQLQRLLYEVIGLPVIGYTKNKQPSTKVKILQALEFHTTDPEVLELLRGLQDFSTVAILLETFIPAMEGAFLAPDGWYYVFGNFNAGGTQSGRLSSSDPNLQNLPTGSEGEQTKKGYYGQLIKSCFEAPYGWILAGLDFNSLEDYISALTTKDPNKLKVYIDGYDGHSLRAFAYFGDQMPDIVDTVESINSIQKKYKPLRQESKAPTFAMTYQGTYVTLMTNCGFSLEKAKMVEGKYQALYKVSIDWVNDKLNKAAEVGYITCAFGLRVRTPLLKQVIRGTRQTPYEAEAEGRSAGNALGQSWCMLNSRAGSEFMSKVRISQYRLDIRPCAQIHDAQYYLLRDAPEVVIYTNENLVKAVQWQEHPDIAHDTVKIGGKLSLFWPHWAEEIEIPNGVTQEKLEEIVQKAISH